MTMQSHTEPPRLWALSTREAALWMVFVLSGCAFACLPFVHSAPVDVRVRLGAAGQELSATTWRLDINSATESELRMLPGIGPRRAQLIVQERGRRGAFATIWDLSAVPGLSRALIQRLEPLIQAKP